MAMATATATATGEAEASALDRLEAATRDARRLQLDTLRSILDRNARVGYLRPLLFPETAADGGLGTADGESPSSSIGTETYRKLVPISTYEDDYARLIQSIADGDSDPTMLSFDSLECFFFSSGTSSGTSFLRPKLIPYFNSAKGKVATALSQQASAAILRSYAPLKPPATKSLWFLYAGASITTKSGLKAMPASAFPMQRQGQRSPILDMCISPPEVLMGLDPNQQTYCHLLCALAAPHLIGAVRAPYAAGLARGLRMLQAKWLQLADDLDRGSPGAEITEPAMRGAVEAFLGGPLPAAAGRVREVCREGRWAGVLPRLFPDLQYVACVSTGSMEQYYPFIRSLAEADGVRVLGSDYMASECGVGINLQRDLPPNKTRYVIIPTAAYFEFLPFELGTGDGGTAGVAVDFAGVEVGKAYEVVVTTYRGLYRCRLGDVVRVVGFHNEAPEVQFLTRAPKSSDGVDAFTELELASAIEAVRQHLQLEKGTDLKVVDYGGFLDAGADPRRVTVFLELARNWYEKPDIDKEELRASCSVLEESLGAVYKTKRASREIGGPVALVVVKEGSFDEVARVALQNGAPANQYKPPKILRNRGLVDVLKERVVLTTVTMPDESAHQ